MHKKNKEEKRFGICVNGGEKESYIYLCGIKPVRSVRLSENITLVPVFSSPDPNDMIECIMKNGDGDETELGLLIATLRKTTAMLKVENMDVHRLAIETWNSQVACVQVAALLNCEISWYFQANEPADKFNATTRVSQIYPNMYKFPSTLVTLNEQKCSYLENNVSIALKLDSDERFSTASNALWSYRWNPRSAVQLSIIWSGIESLFLIERGIKKNLSTAASRFILDNDDMIEEIRNLYGGRCKAVHELKNGSNELLTQSATLLHKLILKCVEKHCVPDVNKLLEEK